MSLLPWNERELTKFGNSMDEKARNVIVNTYDVEISEITGGDNYKIKQYDFKTSDGIKYEVKGDRLSSKTGNFFIEYMGYDRPCGIAATEADKWMLLYDKSFYVIQTEDLEELTFQATRTSQTKDGMTLGKLVRVIDVRPFAIILNILE